MKEEGFLGRRWRDEGRKFFRKKVGGMKDEGFLGRSWRDDGRRFFRKKVEG